MFAHTQKRQRGTKAMLGAEGPLKIGLAMTEENAARESRWKVKF